MHRRYSSFQRQTADSDSMPGFLAAHGTAGRCNRALPELRWISRLHHPAPLHPEVPQSAIPFGHKRVRRMKSSGAAE
jgi:hypothetical protein